MTLLAPMRLQVTIAAALVGIVAMGIGLVLQFGEERAPPSDADAAVAASGAPERSDLVRHLGRAPGDGRSWVLLARMDFDADRFTDAATAYERALASGHKITGDPSIWCEYADALGMAQGGSLAGKPRELVMRALARNPAHPRALEMAGSAAFEAGEYTSAARYWRELLAQLPQRSRERAELATAIRRADERAQFPAMADARVAPR